MVAPLTEDQWKRFAQVSRLLGHLRRAHSAGRTKRGRRKLRLFACACCRSLIWDQPVPELHRQIVDASEQLAEEAIDPVQVATLVRAGQKGLPTKLRSPVRFAAIAMLQTADQSPVAATQTVTNTVLLCFPSGKRTDTRRRLSGVLREIFGNPFQPITVDSQWLEWSNGTVANMVRTIHHERRYSDLPMLGDALEDAGCTNADLLGHCREPGEHFHGCWAVDLLLGRE